MDDERRKFKRYQPLKEVYKLIEGKEYEIGFMGDISRSGAKLFIDKDLVAKLQECFSFRIHYPKQLGFEVLDIKVRQAWKANNIRDNYVEIGCFFESLSEQQENQINLLIGLYETLSS